MFYEIILRIYYKSLGEYDILTFDKKSISFIKNEKDYTIFTSYVMDLPQQLYNDNKDKLARLLPRGELNEEKIISEFKKSLDYLIFKLTNEWYKLNKQEQRIIASLVESHLEELK